MPATVRGWVREEGLKPFLTAVSLFVRYDFNLDDWNAIRHGISATFTSKGVWFDYEFAGKDTARVKLGFDEPGTGVVDFDIEVPEGLAPKVEASAEIVNVFDCKVREV